MEVDIKNLGHLPDTSSRILQTRLWTRSRNLATAIGVGHAKSGWNSQSQNDRNQRAHSDQLHVFFSSQIMQFSDLQAEHSLTHVNLSSVA